MVHLDPTSYLSHNHFEYCFLDPRTRSLLVHPSSSQQAQYDCDCPLGATREGEREEGRSISVIGSREGLRREVLGLLEGRGRFCRCGICETIFLCLLRLELSRLMVNARRTRESGAKVEALAQNRFRYSHANLTNSRSNGRAQTYEGEADRFVRDSKRTNRTIRKKIINSYEKFERKEECTSTASLSDVRVNMRVAEVPIKGVPPTLVGR